VHTLSYYLTHLFGIRHGGINSGLVLFEKIFQKGIIQELGSLGLRKHGPQEKGEFKGIIKGDPVEEEINKGFNDGEKGKDDPVDEPLNVITLLFGFNGFKGLEGRVEETNNGAKDASADSEKDEDGKDRGSAEDKIFLGGLQGILQCKSTREKREG
jgi:hypothetical protein